MQGDVAQWGGDVSGIDSSGNFNKISSYEFQWLTVWLQSLKVFKELSSNSRYVIKIKNIFKSNKRSSEP